MAELAADELGGLQAKDVIIDDCWNCGELFVLTFDTEVCPNCGEVV